MRTTVNILGVNVDKDSFAEQLSKADRFLEEGGIHTIYTPNPEIIMTAYRDKEYAEILNSSDAVVPDGIGVVYASKILKHPVSERGTGFDLTCGIMDIAAEKGYKVFIYGGKEGVAESAAKILTQKGVTIAGTAHGYQKDEHFAMEEIKRSGADIVLVCLGAPKQEKWIYKYKNEHEALYIGAGGSVDVLAGNTKRAPEFFCKTGLEWFYRLIKEPKRIGRMMELPKFALTVIFKKGESKNA